MSGTINESAAGFLEKMADLMVDLERDLLQLETSPQSRALVDRLFRNLHTIKGGAGMSGLESLSRYTHSVENMLDMVRKGGLAMSSGLVSILLEALDCLKSFMSEASGEATLNRELVSASFQRIQQVLANGQVGTAPVVAAATGAAAAAPVPTQTPKPTIAPVVVEAAKIITPDLLDEPDAEAPVAIEDKVPDQTSEPDHVRPEVSASPPNEIMLEAEPNIFVIQFHVDATHFEDEQPFSELTERLSTHGEVLVIPHLHNLPIYDKRQLDQFYLRTTYHMTTALNESQLREILGEWKRGYDYQIRNLTTPPEAPENQLAIDSAVDSWNGGELVAAERLFQPEVAPQPVVPQFSMAAPDPIFAFKDEGQTTAGAASATDRKLSSIRVEVSKLDRLINLVGELITVEARLDTFHASLDQRDPEMAESLLSLLDDSSRTLRELQDQATTIRMVPIGGTFTPMQRLVRDYCRDSGKSIRLEIVGSETEVDKKVGEQFSGPLKHLIRNALDHGIEMPEERIALGKPAEGLVTLSASLQYGLIVIEVKDDGRGIDVEKVVASAIQKGLLDPNHNLSPRESLELIFAPSVSTAAKVTEVSGRGVGMDVVKRDIEALRGTVEISSNLGSGTTITVRIPLTLSIVDGLLVRVGDYCYVIPMTAVEECVELLPHISNSSGSNFLEIRGQLIPYLLLRETFEIPGERPQHEKVVIVSSGERRVGMVVDHLLGDHQTVINALSRLHKNVNCFSGATILGDGSVVLILDVLRLIEFGESRETRLRT